MRRIRRIAAALLCVAASACIKQESTVTLYLDPTGSVTWSILEKNIRSDEKDRDARQTEDQHPARTALQRLAASDIKDTILQDKPPFSVLTEGQFRNLEEMGRRLFVPYGIAGTSVVSRDEEKFIWTLTITAMPKDLSEQDTVELTALFGDKLLVALREGEFVDADGFSINEDKRLAEMSGKVFDDLGPGDPPRVVKLVWRMLRH
jgi:hypothetical protein